MWEWIWYNSSNLYSVIGVVTSILSVSIFIWGLIIGVLRLKLKRNQFKYLNLVVDNQTKQSMKYYVPTRAQNIDPCTEEDNGVQSIKLIPFFIKHVFKDSQKQYFVILADSGMGKTTFLLKLFLEYYKKVFKKYNIIFIPLSLESSIATIRKIENKPATILLLDGLDEDKYAIEDYNKRLRDIYNETELFYKVIISCRTQFFPDSDREPKNIDRIKFGVGNKGFEFVKYYISPFNDKEIDLYLKRKYNRIFERDKIKRSKKVIGSCSELVVRPMLISYIDDLITNKSKKYYADYEVYGELISKWIERESLNDENKKALYKFSERVAEYMYYKKSVYIIESEIERLCKDYNIKIRNIVARSRSLLNRNAEGYYKFAHKSILEFFLAKKAFENLHFRKIITKAGFVGYDMVQVFLHGMSIDYFCKCSDKSLEDCSFEYLQLSGCPFDFISEIRNCNFENCNMHQAYLYKTKFVNTNLSFANLIEADLRDVKLIEVNLLGADLRGANLQDANLMGANLRGANLMNANLKGAIFREEQIEYLEKEYNLEGTMVVISKPSDIISYEDYCKKKH